MPVRTEVLKHKHSSIQNYNKWYMGAGTDKVIKAQCGYLFPILHLVVASWKLKTDHHKSFYTINLETRQIKLGPFPHFPQESKLLNIYQHTTDDSAIFRCPFLPHSQWKVRIDRRQNSN